MMEKENERNYPGIDHCFRCGKHVDELKPFGKEGDPLVGNFEGKKLLLTRRFWDVIERVPLMDQILAERETLNKDELIAKYGEVLLESSYSYEDRIDFIEKSCECRDCILEDGPFVKKY